MNFLELELGSCPEAQDYFQITRSPQVMFYYPREPGGEPSNAECAQVIARGAAFGAPDGAMPNVCSLEQWVKESLGQRDCDCSWALAPGACSGPNDGSTCRSVCCEGAPDCPKCVEQFGANGGCEGGRDGPTLSALAHYLPSGCMPCAHDADIDTMLSELCEPDLPKVTGWAGSKPFATPTPEPEPTCERGSLPIDFANAVILQNNLGGAGPDSGDEILRYGGVGAVDGRAYDLVVSVAEGEYVCDDPTCATRVQGEFGVISLAFGSRAKLLFRFVWPGTYEEVVMDQIDWSTFDFDRSSKPSCKEMIGVATSGKGARAFTYELPLEPKAVVLNNDTQTWIMTDFDGAADHAEFVPSKLADTPDVELLRSSTLKFTAPMLPQPTGWYP